MERYLNIIAFNIPWPANYGGIIDVYYKIKALHQCGVKIILHCFEYERAHSPELEAICEKVFYYKRHTGLRTNITLLPYNVYSRKHPVRRTPLLLLHKRSATTQPEKDLPGSKYRTRLLLSPGTGGEPSDQEKLLPDRGLAIQTLSENTETCRSDHCRFNNRF